MTSRRDCKIKWNPTLVVGTASKGDDKIIKVAYHFSVPVRRPIPQLQTRHSPSLQQDGYVAEYDEEWKVARSLSDKLESVHLVNSKNTNQLFALCTAYAPSKQHDLHPTPFCILPKLDDKGMFFKNRLKLEAYYETKGTSIIQGMKFNDVRRRLRPVYCFDSGSERHWTFKLSEIQRPQSLTYVFRTEKSGAVTICSKERDSELGEEDILAECSQVYQAWEHESMYEAVQPHYPQYQPIRGRTTHPKPLPNMRRITSVLPSLPLTHLQNFDSVDIPYSPSKQRKIKRYKSLTPSPGTPSPSFPSPRVRQHRAMSWNPSAPPTDAEIDSSPSRPLSPASSPTSTATLTAFDGDPSPKPFQSSPELSSVQIDASGRSGANRGVKKRR
ncbi:hypothetical protein C8Q75DRAFT_183273 [Abortiporus biennis]|nr:hypothetical protein C8Q75DRAFT_183273 [Abortiporus biennis]